MKKILVVLDGERVNGNTSKLVDAFIRGASEAGHDVEKVSLNKIEVRL